MAILPGRARRGGRWTGCTIVLAALLPGTVFAAEAGGRGFLDEVREDGSRTVKAWLRTGSEAAAFYSIAFDRAGRMASVCSDPSPIPEDALESPIGDMDTITSWTWRLLSAKGYGRVLVGFWDTEEGAALAAAAERGSGPAPCWWRQPVGHPAPPLEGGWN